MATAPTDYRIERIAARLIERLEHIRPSLPDTPGEVARVLERVTRDQVEAALAEYRAVAMPDHPEVQERFVREEILRTFLPRYVRLTLEMNRRAEGAYGLGWLAEPVGRVVLSGLSLVLLVFAWRVIRPPILWPVVLAFLAMPWMPDLVEDAARRRHRRRLAELVADLAVLQDLSETWLRRDELDPEGHGFVLLDGGFDGSDDQSTE